MKFGKNAKSRRMARSTKSKGKMPAGVRPKTTAVIKTIARNEAKRVVSRNAENKFAWLQAPSTLGTYTSFNNTIALADFINVMPPVSQGVTESGRIGNKIKLKGLYVKGHVNVVYPTVGAGVTTSLNIYVRLLCLEDKSYLGSGVGAADILDRAGVNTQFLGYPQDLYTPVDKSRFIVHYDKVVKLQNPNMPQNTSGYINANIMTTHFFQFKIKGGRTLEYDSNTATIPSKFCPQFAAVVCDPAMILAGNSPLVTPCQYTLGSQLYYEDA